MVVVGVRERARGPKSLSEHLTTQVLALVQSEKLQPGDKLPSVKELADRFSVAGRCHGDVPRSCHRQLSHASIKTALNV